MDLAAVLGLVVPALGVDANGGAARTVEVGNLEVAVLDRNRPRRAFRRLARPLLERLLGVLPCAPEHPSRVLCVPWMLRWRRKKVNAG